MSAAAPQSRKLLLTVVAGVVAWGVYHVVGAANNVHLRPGAAWVVFAAFVAFLGLWGVALAMQSVRARGSAAAAGRGRWSYASLGSFSLMLLAVAAGGALRAGVLVETPSAATGAIWAIFGLAGLALLFAIIGLSDPAEKAGKGLAILTFVLLGLLAAEVFRGGFSSVPVQPTPSPIDATASAPNGQSVRA